MYFYSFVFNTFIYMIVSLVVEKRRMYLRKNRLPSPQV